MLVLNKISAARSCLDVFYSKNGEWTTGKPESEKLQQQLMQEGCLRRLESGFHGQDPKVNSFIIQNGFRIRFVGSPNGLVMVAIAACRKPLCMACQAKRGCFVAASLRQNLGFCSKVAGMLEALYIS